MKTVLKNIRIVDPEQGIDEVASLLLENGIIVKKGNLTEADEKEAQVYELDEKVCVPGLFDMHVHLGEPGYEHLETIASGSNAAAEGGFTAFACMPNTNPPIDSAEIIYSIKAKAAKHLVDVFPYGCATAERKGEGLAPIAEMFEAGAVGFTDDGKTISTADLLKNVLDYAGMFNAVVIDHCEDPSLTTGTVANESVVSTELGLPGAPSISEDIMVMRDIMVAEYNKGRIHIAHVSTKRSVELIREAKKRGVNITAETAPQYFSMTEEAIKSFDTNCKVNPPLRSAEDVKAVVEGLKDGTIDCIASNHTPVVIEDKDREFIYAPFGMIGLETMLGLTLSELLHKNVLSIQDVVMKLAVNPRKVLNIAVPKIVVGEKADLTIMDTEEVWTVDVKQMKSKSKNTPFDKKLLTGKSVGVVNNGKMYLNGKYTAV